MSDYCCDKFEEYATKYEGKGMSMYPMPSPVSQFNLFDDGTWGIYGCCHGGCYVVQGMKYCPFCGVKL